MTPKEFAHATMLVASLRTRLGHANALTAAVTAERDDLAKQLAAHVESLTLSNAQCAEYLLHNEMLAADRATLHRELVEVSAALASVTEQRDSLRRTLDEWERADTKPHALIDPPIRMGLISETGPVVFVRIGPKPADDDVADHVAPPVLHVGEPDPVNDPKDAALEFRNVVPTPEMLRHVGYWDLVSGAAAIAFKPGGLRLVFWRISGSQEWRTDPCPQPLKPHGMTWQQLDNALANQQPVPMCATCHECGGELRPSPAAGSHSVLYCRTERCSRKNTAWRDELSPYHGPCKSATPVRHE